MSLARKANYHLEVANDHLRTLKEAVQKLDILEQHAEKLVSLLKEWRDTDYFSEKESWQRWVNEYGARVDKALAGWEVMFRAPSKIQSAFCACCDKDPEYCTCEEDS